MLRCFDWVMKKAVIPTSSWALKFAVAMQSVGDSMDRYEVMITLACFAWFTAWLCKDREDILADMMDDFDFPSVLRAQTLDHWSRMQPSTAVVA